MKIYAYRLEQKGPRSLQAVIDRIHGLAIGDRFIGDMGVRLEDRGQRSGFLMMDFARIRSGHGPGRLRRHHPMQEFQLAQDENFGEDTGIAYDPQTRYAAVQYNHIGPRALLIERYLRAADLSFGQIRQKQQGEHNEDVAGFVFASTLKRDAYAKLRSMGIYKEVEFTVSIPGVVPEDLPEGRSLRSVLSSALPQGVESLTVRMNATPYERNSSLGSGSVRQLMQDLRRLGGNLKKATISGKRAQGERVESIDLLSEQVMSEPHIALGAGGRYAQHDRWTTLATTLRGWIDNGDVPV